MPQLRFPHHIAHEHEALAHALEDLPEDVHQDVGEITGTPDRKLTAHKIREIFENLSGAVDGGAEDVTAHTHFAAAERLADKLRRLRSYTYVVDEGVLVRGARPTPQKVRDLVVHNGVRSTVNLCSEMLAGDTSIIAAAGLTPRDVRTLHVPVIDEMEPDLAQVLEFLDFVAGEADRSCYVHCEAGIGRTGIMVACYRMACMGWGPGPALQEAVNFGCTLPGQHAFILDFAGKLEAGEPELRSRGYPTPLRGPDPASVLGPTVASCLDPGAC